MKLDDLKFDLSKFDPDQAQAFTALVLNAVQAIAQVVSPDKALAANTAITIVQQVINGLIDAYSGRVPYDKLRGEFDKLLAANDAHADQLLAEKFAPKP